MFDLINVGIGGPETPWMNSASGVSKNGVTKITPRTPKTGPEKRVSKNMDANWPGMDMSILAYEMTRNGSSASIRALFELFDGVCERLIFRLENGLCSDGTEVECAILAKSLANALNFYQNGP